MNLSPELAKIVFWICVASCALAQTALVRSALRSRRVASDATQADSSPRGLEMLWAIVPVVALVLVFASSWQAMQRVSDASNEQNPSPPATLTRTPTRLATIPVVAPAPAPQQASGKVMQRQITTFAEPVYMETAEDQMDQR